jgi:carbon monoxide dehydrogenase subunit G
MEFQNEFDVKAPIDEVYKTMLDLERVAPAMPGAEVLEKTDDDHYKVGIKVKVGPISMQYRGDVEVVDKNPEAHSAKLKVHARETRGQGTASADVDMRLDDRGEATHGHMTANVQLAGRAAAMGRGVIQDVSAKLVDQFARNLGQMLGEQPQAQTAAPTNGGAAAGAPAPTADTGSAAAAPASGGAQTPAGAGSAAGADATTKAGGAAGAAAGAGAQGAAASESASTWSQHSSDEEGVDALGIAASVAGDRLRDPKVLLGLVGIVLLIGWLLGRRS